MPRDVEPLDERRWRRIKDAFEESGMSLGELAAAAKVDKSTLSRVLNRKQDAVTRRVLRSIGDALDDLEPADLIDQVEFNLDDESIERAKRTLERQLLEIRDELDGSVHGFTATGVVRVELKRSARTQRVYQRSFGLSRKKPA